jgi:MFS family permease
VRSYRYQWPADLATSCAFEMETLILGWYVLVETGSVLMLTLFGALQFAGTLVAPLFGVMGDRLGHRNVLCGMRAVYAALAATLMTLAFAGVLSPLWVLVVTGLMGLVRPSDLGVRAALVADNVPADQLMAAISISRTTSDTARVGGALAGAGIFAAFGVGPAYVAVTTLYVLGMLLTLAIGRTASLLSPSDTAQIVTPRPSAWRDMWEGIAYVWSTPQLLAAMLLACLVNLTAFPLSGGLLPYVAKEIHHLDQTGLGFLVASFASGALVGSLAVSMRREPRPGRTMIVSGIVWYALLVVFAQMRQPYGAALALMLAGFAQSVCMVTLAVLALRITEVRFRGRVMGVRMLVIYSLPFGLFAAGALIGRIGFTATATLYAVVGLLLTLAIAVRWRRALWYADAGPDQR